MRYDHAGSANDALQRLLREDEVVRIAAEESNAACKCGERNSGVNRTHRAGASNALRLRAGSFGEVQSPLRRDSARFASASRRSLHVSHLIQGR